MADENIEFEDQADYGDESTEPPKSGFKKKMSSSLSGSGVALTFIAVAAIVVVTAGTLGLKGLFVDPEPEASSQVQSSPRDSGEAPTGEDASEAYKERIRDENERRRQQAEESGDSAVPTLLGDAIQIEGGCDEECQERLVGMIERQDRRITQLSQAVQDSMRQPQAVPEEAYTPNRIVYDDNLYMTEAEQTDRTNRMQQEIESVAQAMSASLSGHGFASSHGDSNQDGDGNAQGGSGSPSGNQPANGDGSTSRQAPPAGGPTGAPLIAQAETRYATLDMTANSDVPGPIRATIHQGKFKGSKVLGQFEKMDNYLVIRFTSLTTPEDSKTLPPGRTYSIDAIAVNEATRMVGMADEVDRHLFTKAVAIGGAAFLQGFGEAFTQAGSTEITSGGNAITTRPRLTLEDKALSALGEVGVAAGDYLEPYANQPNTVIKYADTGFAMLFLKPVADDTNG